MAVPAQDAILTLVRLRERMREREPLTLRRAAPSRYTEGLDRDANESPIPWGLVGVFLLRGSIPPRNTPNQTLHIRHHLTPGSGKPYPRC